MTLNNDKRGKVIGQIFTIVSFSLTFTFVVPIISVLPGGILESIFSNIINDTPYSNIGIATLITLILTFVASLIGIFIWSKKRELRNNHIVLIMLFEYFTIHTLGFYIYWATSLDFKSDGQLIFGAIKTYPITSFSFLILGIFIDKIQNKFKSDV